MGSRQVAGVAFAGGLLALCACNPQAPQPTPAPSNTPAAPATQPPLHITGQGTSTRPVRAVYEIHNHIAYELNASSFESRGPQGRTRAVFQSATVTFHAADGGTTTARAPQAVVDETADTLTMLGGVIAHSSSSIVLQCDRLVYDRATQMLHGTGNVTIVDQHGFKATGSSFDSDLSLTHVKMR